MPASIRGSGRERHENGTRRTVLDKVLLEPLPPLVVLAAYGAAVSGWSSVCHGGGELGVVEDGWERRENVK